MRKVCTISYSQAVQDGRERSAMLNRAAQSANKAANAERVTFALSVFAVALAAAVFALVVFA